jgi:NTE family protein
MPNNLLHQLQQKEKIGIALSGGGFRGVMHLGVLKALEDAEIEVSEISATSFGAFVGAFHANGLSANEILDIFQSISWWKTIRPTLNWKGLASIQALAKTFRKYLPETFEELQKPLTINATDLEKGETVYFNSGNLIAPLLASACVPILFKPMKIGTRQLADGGILNNLPAEPLQPNCDFIIGVNCNHAGEKKVSNYKTVIERTFNLAINQNTNIRKPLCNWVIEPPKMANYQTFEIGKMQEMFDIGFSFIDGELKRIR